MLLVPAGLGFVVFRFLHVSVSSGEKLDVNNLNVSVLYVVGLLYLLFTSYFLKAFSLPWGVACYLPCVLLLFDKRSVGITMRLLSPERTPAFLLWFFVVTAIGISLCTTLEGIETSWVNNYGDLTFHLGIISSFVFGDNLPPEYHIYAGEPLSYPFFVNFWSALLWWPYSEWRLLSIIFTVQWTVLWFLVYRLLSGSRYVILPWAVLLGGGSYLLLGEMSTKFISKGYPWAVFISTIWVPQRTFLLGVVALITLLTIAFRGFSTLQSRHEVLFGTPVHEQIIRMSIIGFGLGVTFICHGHSALVLTLFFLLVFAGKTVRNFFDSAQPTGTNFLPVNPVALIAFFAIFFAVGLAVSPWLAGKTGLIQPIAGWTGSDTTLTGFVRIKAMLWMWFKNFGQGLILIVPLLFFRRYRSEAFACLALFILFNFVQIAAWKWDQIKLFIALYVILLTLWSFSVSRMLYYAHYLLVVLLVPGLVECYYLFQEGPRFVVYDIEKMRQAEGIRNKTPSNAVIAAAPEHHSAVTISGRSLFMGYPGTLWSHSIAYADREAVNRSLTELIECPQKHAERMPCPDFLLWDTHAKKYWPGSSPEQAGLPVVQQPFLFRLGKNE